MKATCRKAEEAQTKVVEPFTAVVERAQKEGWTVAKAREALRERRRAGGRTRKLPCIERGGKDHARLTVHLDRLRAAGAESPETVAEVLETLRQVVRDIEAAEAAAAAPAGADAR